MKYKSFDELILMEDENFIIVNKPPYLSSLSDRNDKMNLLEMARNYFAEAKVCHRLDKETSGILVIAKNLDYYKYFANALQNRKITKIYHAIVDGRQEVNNVIIDKPISIGSTKSKIDFRDGKDALTIVSTLEIFKQNSLMACQLVTGRMHQIRVHLSFLNMPIMGDEMYGGKKVYLSQLKKKYQHNQKQEELPIIQRIALHAQQIEFKNIDDKVIKIEAPYPKDFAVLVQQLRKY